MLWTLFSTFAKIGAFTIGGGVAMIPIIQQDVVYRHHWMDDEEFLDVLAVAQSAPGLMAVNIAIFVGYKVSGIKGSLIATLGSIIPPFLIILVIASAFKEFNSYPAVQAAFAGIRPAVVGLIAAPMINMIIQSKPNFISISVIIISIVLITYIHISPIWILSAISASALIYTYIKVRRSKS